MGLLDTLLSIGGSIKDSLDKEMDNYNKTKERLEKQVNYEQRNIKSQHMSMNELKQEYNNTNSDIKKAAIAREVKERQGK